MRGDGAAGAIVLTIGVVVVAMASTFPAMPGQNVGPALFPLLIGGGFVVCGAVLLIGPRFGRPADAVVLDDGFKRPRMVLNAALVVVALLLFAMLVGTLGFFLASSALLVTLFLAFGARPGPAVAIALIAPLCVHYVFYTVLRVPLPWGFLQSVAW